jgi:hypothetical protein
MRETNLADWGIFRKEPDKAWLTYKIYESDSSDFAFYFYNIGEWGLMKYASKLQILKDKSTPKVIYDSEKIRFLFNVFDEKDFIYDWTPQGLICLRQLIPLGHNKYSYPFMVINLVSVSYAIIEDTEIKTLEKTTASIINITYTTDLTGELNLNDLKWRPLTGASF